MKSIFHSEHVKNIVMIIAGNFLVACAVTFFILPNQILTGGVAGVSVALYPITHIDSIIMINALTISLYLLGVVTLGKVFAMKSLISAIVYPFLITGLSCVTKQFPTTYFQMDVLVATIYAGVCMGAGLGIVFRANGSTGGMDIPALILTKYTSIRSGNSVMIVDGLTVVLGVLTYGLVPALIGIISVYVCGKTINAIIMIKSEKALELQIISESYEIILDYILQEIDRGATITYGFGAYTKEPRSILMCVVSQKQYPDLEHQIQRIDPSAFVIVKDVNRVKGEGF